nr:hypothetical protein CFP56_10491 [Quercus suber]
MAFDTPDAAILARSTLESECSELRALSIDQVYFFTIDSITYRQALMQAHKSLNCITLCSPACPILVSFFLRQSQWQLSQRESRPPSAMDLDEVTLCLGQDISSRFHVSVTDTQRSLLHRWQMNATSSTAAEWPRDFLIRFSWTVTIDRGTSGNMGAAQQKSRRR